MAKQPEQPKPGLSRLGRGLGSLIPVPAQPKGPEAPTQRVGEGTLDRGGTLPSSPHVETAGGPTAGSAPSRHVVPAAATSPAEVHIAPSVEPLTAEESRPAPGVQVQYLPVAAIRAGTYQPRGAMDDSTLAALAASITQSGLMQPVVVRPDGVGMGRYELIAGERRWRAVQRLGWSTIPAIVRAVGDQEAAELALVENVQREDLNPMDRAHALRRLVSDFGLAHHTLADRLGVDRSTVTNLLRLNDLESEVAGLVRSGELSLGQYSLKTTAGYPKHLYAIFKLVESDSNDAKVAKQLTDTLSFLASTIIGAMLSPAAGAVVGAVIGAIDNLIANVIDEDELRPYGIRLTLSNQNQFGGPVGPKQRTGTITGHGGKYRIGYRWVLGA